MAVGLKSAQAASSETWTPGPPRACTAKMIITTSATTAASSNGPHLPADAAGSDLVRSAVDLETAQRRFVVLIGDLDHGRGRSRVGEAIHHDNRQPGAPLIPPGRAEERGPGGLDVASE